VPAERQEVRTVRPTAVVWVPYSDELTKWSIGGTVVAMAVIWAVFHGRR